MDSFQNLMMGFSIALTPQNLMFAFLGSFVGTLVGVLPGVGPTAGIAILIPLSFNLDPTGAIIMLAAIFYGSEYGGTITSVLMNVPGEASTAVTCLEGFPMAKQGRAGAALAVAAIGSFIGGTISVIGLVIAAPPLARLATSFGPAEYFCLIMVGLSLIMGLAGKSVVKSLLMGAFGLLLAVPGIDIIHGYPRFTFGQTELQDGIGFIPVIMGMFGIGDILLNASEEITQVFATDKLNLMPTRKDIRDSVGPIIRGTGIGFVLGIIPGMSAVVSSFMSYICERKLSKEPEKWGTGMIQGVAGPETANNAHADAQMIPLFTLGIPTSPTIALLMSAFIMNGLNPGPSLFRDRPDVVWAIIASMYIGNIILLILNLPLIPMWVAILKIPYSILFAVILVFTLIGSYSLKNSVFDVGVMVLFGLVGFVLKKLELPLAPFALTFILGPRMEVALRQSLTLYRGDFGRFLESPLRTVLLALAVVFLVAPALRPLASRLNPVREDIE